MNIQAESTDLYKSIEKIFQKKSINSQNELCTENINGFLCNNIYGCTF